LENKVVELTQSIITLKTENKELTQKISHLELQIQQWVEKHEKLDKEAKEMQTQLRESTVPQSVFDALKAEKESAVSQHSATMNKMAQLTDQIQQVQLELKLEKEKNQALEAKQTEVINNEEVTDLKAQIVALKAQLAKALHTRQLSPMKPASRNISPSNNNSRRLFADEHPSESQDSIKPLRNNDNILTNRKTRRYSSAETIGNVPKTSVDQIRKAGELGSRNPRPTSVGQSNTIAGGKSNLLDVISDNPEEEVASLLITWITILTNRLVFRSILYFDKKNRSRKKCSKVSLKRSKYLCQMKRTHLLIKKCYSLLILLVCALMICGELAIIENRRISCSLSWIPFKSSVW
jgi:myosin-5